MFTYKIIYFINKQRMNNVPVEIITLIISFLDPIDAIKSGRVCTEWYDIVQKMMPELKTRINLHLKRYLKRGINVLQICDKISLVSQYRLMDWALSLHTGYDTKRLGLIRYIIKHIPGVSNLNTIDHLVLVMKYYDSLSDYIYDINTMAIFNKAITTNNIETINVMINERILSVGINLGKFNCHILKKCHIETTKHIIYRLYENKYFLKQILHFNKVKCIWIMWFAYFNDITKLKELMGHKYLKRNKKSCSNAQTEYLLPFGDNGMIALINSGNCHVIEWYQNNIQKINFKNKNNIHFTFLSNVTSDSYEIFLRNIFDAMPMCNIADSLETTINQKHFCNTKLVNFILEYIINQDPDYIKTGNIIKYQFSNPETLKCFVEHGSVISKYNILMIHGITKNVNIFDYCLTQIDVKYISSDHMMKYRPYDWFLQNLGIMDRKSNVIKNIILSKNKNKHVFELIKLYHANAYPISHRVYYCIMFRLFSSGHQKLKYVDQWLIKICDYFYDQGIDVEPKIFENTCSVHCEKIPAFLLEWFVNHGAKIDQDTLYYNLDDFIKLKWFCEQGYQFDLGKIKKIYGQEDNFLKKRIINFIQKHGNSK